MKDNIRPIFLTLVTNGVSCVKESFQDCVFDSTRMLILLLIYRFLHYSTTVFFSVLGACCSQIS